MDAAELVEEEEVLWDVMARQLHWPCGLLWSGYGPNIILK